MGPRGTEPIGCWMFHTSPLRNPHSHFALCARPPPRIFRAMITFLEGTLVEALPTHVVVNVHGVGYHVGIPLSSYDKLPAVGAPIKILTHLQVREDAHV